ncbi:MAG: type II secretion system protein [Acidobacteriota bacterium]|nr:type II secretion system protein [Acidobacteriota bacterium]
MKHITGLKLEHGFTMTELLISIVILIPIMGAAVSLFSTGAEQQASEQNSIDANQEARSALQMMSTEIAQAGSHGDVSTVTTGSVSASSSAQALSVASTAGLTVGDWVDVDYGADHEMVQITAIGNNSISGVFRTGHTSGKPVRLFAMPFTSGVIPPAGMAASTSSAVTTLRFFGDINSDATLQYVEYNYDSANNQITRSITPVTQSNKNAALPLIRNLKPNSVQFRLNTDAHGIVTSVNLAFTVQGTWKTAGQVQETELSTKVLIPSAVASSALLYEVRRYGGIDRFPPTPAQVTTWVNQ